MQIHSVPKDLPKRQTGLLISNN